MHTEYKTLARLFHADGSGDAFRNHEAFAKQRLESDSTYRTGIVTSLGELFIGMPRETIDRIAEILTMERKISNQWQRISGVMRWNYIHHFIADELQATNEMEGVRSTRKEVEMAVEAASAGRSVEHAKRQNNVSDTRFGEFAKLYLNLTDNNTVLPRSLEDIRSVYDKIALDGIKESDKPDGKLFRARGVHVEGPRGVEHEGIRGEDRISALLTQMLALVASEDMPLLISALASHFLFEYIHPFYDGNGRTGRYLLALYLSRVLTLPTVLSLSRAINERKSAYYRAFTVTEDKLNCGELTFFINTMLDLILEAQWSLVEDIALKLDRYERAAEISKFLSQKAHLDEHTSYLLHGVMQEELFDTRKSMSLQDIAEHCGVTKQSARKYVGKLEDLGWIERVSGRPLRVHAGKRLVAVMNGEMDMAGLF